MRNKIEIVSEALNKHFTDVSVDRFEILYPILTDAGLLLPPMRGRGFFPAADGLWKEDGERGLRPFPDRPLMFVGQDFDDEDYEGEYYKSIKNDDYHEEPAEGAGSHTWRNQLGRLEKAGISRSICFHTNLFPGVRIAAKNHGGSTALSDKEFVDRCVDFLDVKIKIIEPRGVIFFGMKPTQAVFHRWLPGRPNFRNGVAIDEAGYACFSLEREAGSLKMAWLTHPCMGYANSGRRKYKGLTGVEAELAILRECAL